MKSRHAKHAHIMTTKWFFIIVSFILLFLFWKLTQPFAITLITAAVAAIVLAPLDRWVELKVKSRRVAAVLMLLFILLVVLVPVFFIGLLMVQQASEIIQATLNNGSWLRSFNLETNSIFLSFPEIVRDQILGIDFVEVIKRSAEWVFQNIGSLFSNIINLFFQTMFFFIALYYFLIDRDRFYKEVLEISPLKDSLDKKIVKRIINTVRSVVFGALIVAVLQGIFAAIGLTIFGVPGALLWGAIVIIAAQVPVIGASLVMIPAIIYLFILGDTPQAIGLTVWSVVVVGLLDNIVSPYLIEGKTKMHGLFILISILGGLQMFGSIGFIIGPTILAGVMVVVELYKSGILEK